MKLIPIFTYPKMAAPHGSPSYREAAHIIRDKQTSQSFNTYGATPQEQWNTAGVLTTKPGYHFPPKDNKQTRQARSTYSTKCPRLGCASQETDNGTLQGLPTNSSQQELAFSSLRKPGMLAFLPKDLAWCRGSGPLVEPKSPPMLLD